MSAGAPQNQASSGSKEHEDEFLFFFALLFCLFVCLFKVGNQTGQVENPHPPVYACELLY